MKSYQLRRSFVILVASSFLACAVALVWGLLGKQPGLAAQTSQADSPPSAEEAHAPAERPVLNRGPRLAPSLLAESQPSEAVEAVPEAEPSPDRMETERFFAEERRIMAKTWKLTEKQASQFEIAVRDAFAERADTFARMMLDNLSPAEVSKELEATAKRAEERLREVLGPDHLLEYKYTAGNFVSGGFDKKPFVPPIIEAARNKQPT